MSQQEIERLAYELAKEINQGSACVYVSPPLLAVALRKALDKIAGVSPSPAGAR